MMERGRCQGNERAGIKLMSSCVGEKNTLGYNPYYDFREGEGKKAHDAQTGSCYRTPDSLKRYASQLAEGREGSKQDKNSKNACTEKKRHLLASQNKKQENGSYKKRKRLLSQYHSRVAR